ncbi:hypothetical protein N7450_011474 [Penicillium hetheringtonii]|uniref:Uncharacterized protein n=1 Tax=Penicillium hetheringtonii TaxID=911720 RepID=A0AAD6DAB4_9EURO|nr:hypothetical protein N7450_011474 [Penicillium hetheringtonii]
MRIIYVNGFSDDERRQTRATILANLLDAFKILLDIMATERLDFGCERAKQSAALLAIMEPEILLIRIPLDTPFFTAMKSLWQDPGVKVAVSISRSLPFHDNLLYLYHSIDRISAPEWIPSDQDILRVRLRTTGISEIFFDMGRMIWSMIDVGGQRSERKKWIHCFEDVDYLIFVAALSGYDQCLVEDHTADKLAVSSISAHFPDINCSETDSISAAYYFVRRFHKLNKTRNRLVYSGIRKKIPLEDTLAFFPSDPLECQPRMALFHVALTANHSY